MERVSSAIRSVRRVTSEAANYYRTQAPVYEKAALGFMILGAVDLTQVIVNRGLIHSDPISATIETMADMGMVFGADSLQHSPRWLKWFGAIEGTAGIAASAMIKTGNPDLFYPALITAGASAILGMLDVASNRNSVIEVA